MFLARVPFFMGSELQEWNRNYKAAQTIFGGGPASSSAAVRAVIQTGHRLLYARSMKNVFGTIERSEDVIKLLQGGGNSPHANRVKPAVYTYVLSPEDDSLRFSETGAAFFVDFASKHALHANCTTSVRYSGEFHPRPEGGWAKFSEHDAWSDEEVRWEFVVDNNSGTYAPNKADLPKLKALLEFNFPWLTIVALDRDDPELEESREACRAYAMKYRGVAMDELQPHMHEEEETLMHSVKMTMEMEASANEGS